MFFPTKKKKSPTISKIGYWIFVHPYKISPYNYHLFKSPPGRNLRIWSSLLAYFFLRSSLRLLFVLPRSSGDLRFSSSIFCSSNRWSEKIVCYLVTLVGFTFQFLDRDSNLWSFRLLLLLFLYFLLYVWRKTSGTVRKKNHIFVRVRWYLECLAHVEEERRVVQDAEESGIGAWWERTNRFKRKQHIITNRIFSANNNTNIYSMMMVAQLWV